MRTTITSRDETMQGRIERMARRFPELRPADAGRSLATGEKLGGTLGALADRVRQIKWVWRGRQEVVTVFVDDLRV